MRSKIGLSHYRGIVACLVLLGAAAGCGPSDPPLYPVKGRVLFTDGSPVQGGTIEFMSLPDKRSAVGAIQLDGSFYLTTKEEGDGAAAGKHKIVVIQGLAPIVSAHSHSHGRRVPPKYARYETSDLTAEVKPAGDNDIRVLIE